MKRRHHTPEQIVRKLREADRMLGEGHREYHLGDRKQLRCLVRNDCQAPELERAYCVLVNRNFIHLVRILQIEIGSLRGAWG